MGKLKNFISKIIRGIRGKKLSPPPPKIKTESVLEIERAIDTIVYYNLENFKNLMSISSSEKYWQNVFKALAFAESGFNLTETYLEHGLGVDAVTGKQNTSEGLLQLSYQDAKYHKCNFYWNIDKNLSSNDLRKSIFDIKNNILCGMQIMDFLVGKHGTYIFDKGNYWAVLKPNNSRHIIFKSKFNEYAQGV